MLNVNAIEVVYSNVIWVLRSVSLCVPDGQIVALLGANGAGKTTALRAISGLLHSEQGAITAGSVELDGQRIDRLATEDIARLGIVQVIEGRRLFRHLTSEENLRIGGYILRDAAVLRRNLERTYEYFPRLQELRHRISGYLSGGEQQMLVIGRALMSDPGILLLDEPSLGLAPLVVREIFDILRRINKQEGKSVLLVEQNAKAALALASYAYVIENGRLVLDGPADRLAENEDVREFYLGLSKLGERKSYREAKHYKRRKRWLG